MITTIYLALGSNKGDRLAYLKKACEALAQRGVEVVRSSSVYETEPFYKADGAEWFLNQVIEGRTTLSAQELLSAVQAIEVDLGRDASEHGGPRKIDIDILLYGNEQIDEPGLTIPHPGLAERQFVLVLLAEIAPEGIEPRSGETIRALLSKCPDRHKVRLLN